ncbi:hypothetical protein HH213_07225 [Duganella dendranthematis]|uniref:DUF4398 domain-containing protein n=1 Tax=Duganella dendranthematis TaxID=2728021 RepID=A0ABX6M6I2_9BURK|nr:hypothetical protein [Duganella dendranthematis]QJD89908.1 hypothetical protein HH213_07225 [Duganella dendranthematis]
MTVSTKPSTVTINEHSSIAFPQAAALIRQGYVFTGEPPTTYLNGQASINLTLGAPDQHAVNAAEATIKLYTDLAEAASQRDAAKAALHTAEAIERQNRKAAFDVQIADQEKVIRKLKEQQKKI